MLLRIAHPLMHAVTPFYAAYQASVTQVGQSVLSETDSIKHNDSSV